MRLISLVAAAILVAGLAPSMALGQTAVKKLEGKLKAPAKASPAAAAPATSAPAFGAPATGAAGASAPADAATPAPGYLGIEADESTVPGRGVLITKVRKGAPSELGGLRDGDMITAIDGKPCRTLDDLDAALAKATVGKKVVMTLQRGGLPETKTITLGRRPTETAPPIEAAPAEGAADVPAPTTPAADPLFPTTPPRTAPPPAGIPREPAASSPSLRPAADPLEPSVDPPADPLATPPTPEPPLTLAEPPATDPLALPTTPEPDSTNDPPAIGGLGTGRATLGVAVVPLNAETRGKYDVRATVRQGAIIHSVRPGSPADLVGLPVGGVIVSIDGQLVKSSEDLASAVAAGRPGQEVELRYMLEGDRVTTKSVRLAPAAATAIVPAAPRADPLAAGDGPNVRRFEDSVDSPPADIARVPIGSSIANPRRVAEMYEEIKALKDQVKALEERLKLLEGKPASDLPGLNP